MILFNPHLPDLISKSSEVRMAESIFSTKNRVDGRYPCTDL